ncbi:MarR family winged helix-turn-helix transcriptional regulator [Virgibacillus sp. SK37]|uniref:MarR family winged helix-turn-helix transcriptional regulator n=1 Tax=Virgibacillus sp. SK37 TaxID=403957 RepID=UPI0005957224|nr:MarR family transcriptional regulator [Virgibacillus sp. SK37]
MVEKEIRELLQTIAAKSRKAYARQFRHVDLHIGQETALCQLWMEDGLNQSQLRDKMGCEASTLSNMLRKLEQDEFIYRKQDEIDARSTRVFLTEKGKQLKEPISRVWEDQQQKMLNGILPEELLFMRRLLKQMEANLRED